METETLQPWRLDPPSCPPRQSETCLVWPGRPAVIQGVQLVALGTLNHLPTQRTALSKLNIIVLLPWLRQGGESRARW